MLPRFTLSPWEFPGVPGSRRADAITQAQWRGREVTMRLKVRENRLFFAPLNEKGGRLFSVFGPLEKTAEAADAFKNSPEELVARFHKALNEKLWGRVVFCRPEEDGHNALSIVMVTIRRDGRMEMRQLFDDESLPVWVDWEKETDFKLPLNQFEIWPNAKITRFLHCKMEYALRLVNKRFVSKAAMQRGIIKTVWRKGSSDELETLIRAAAHLFQDFDENDESPFPDGATFEIHAQDAQRGARVFYGECFGEANPKVLGLLFPLFLRLHHPVGQSVETTYYRDNTNPAIWEMTVEPPTQHEKLEALATLREMTRGTKIEADVEAVLQKFLPMGLPIEN